MATKTIKDKIEIYFLSALLLSVFILAFLVLRPYISILLLAIVLVILFRPIFEWINSRIRKHRLIASLLTTLLVVIIILIPLSIFTGLVANEVNGYLNSSKHFLFQDSQLPSFIQKYNFDFKDYFKGVVSGTLNDIGKIFSNLAQLFIGIILTVVSMVYLFKDGNKIEKSLFSALPLRNEQRVKLETDLVQGIRAVIGGYFLVAILQGIVTGFGFWIFHVPNPALWGFIAVILALLPSMGTAFINIPAVIYLFYINLPGYAIGLAIWYLISIGIIDNFIGPRFISGRVRIHILVLIFSTIGGVSLFGPIGIIVGPLIMILFDSVLGLFRERENEMLKE